MTNNFKIYDIEEKDKDFLNDLWNKGIMILNDLEKDVSLLEDYSFRIIKKSEVVGACNSSIKTICLTQYFVDYCKENHKEKELLEIILHEMLHGINPNNHHHDKQWLSDAEDVYNTYKLECKYKYSDDGYDDYLHDQCIIKPYKYLLRCEKCHNILKVYKSKTYVVRDILKGVKCEHIGCGGMVCIEEVKKNTNIENNSK